MRWKFLLPVLLLPMGFSPASAQMRCWIDNAAPECRFNAKCKQVAGPALCACLWKEISGVIPAQHLAEAVNSWIAANSGKMGTAETPIVLGGLQVASKRCLR